MPFLKDKTEIKVIKVREIASKWLKFPTPKITDQSPFFKLIAVFCFYAEFYFLVTNKVELYLFKYYKIVFVVND